MHEDLPDLDADGLPAGRDCPTCSAPLVPEVLEGDRLAIVWSCPTHGLADVTADPWGDT